MLKNQKMDNMIPEELKLQSIQVALKKMFNDGYFCICTFNKCATLAGVKVDEEIKAFLDPMHCAHFNTMSDELKTGIMEAISITLGQKKMDFTFIDRLQLDSKIESAEFSEVKKGGFEFLKKLIK